MHSHTHSRESAAARVSAPLSLDAFLAPLRKVRRLGADKAIACCPAHEDRSPSLSVTQAGDRLLLKCFGGCRTEDVLAAMGLTWADVMPPRNMPETPEERRKVRQLMREANWAAALEVLALEAKIVLLAGQTYAPLKLLAEDDQARLEKAVHLIDGAAAVFCEGRKWRPDEP